ncbi:MAG: cell division protein ZapA [Bacteroidales bacterium]|jgi:cell division protein ZapA|nr:cell division protein ZapA [Bacteroidales bacterium]MDD3272860.1 cell division protein ZapA [Bacteroidales bacterium]MDD4058462.1 cell division protein ZapA [Bacteroidales bacterium]
MSELQSIQISIADRYYPLKIALQDEEKIRSAVKIINEKVDLYRKRFTNRDIQDALSITLLQFVIRLIEAEQREESTHIVEEIQNISNLLDEYISVNLS